MVCYKGPVQQTMRKLIFATGNKNKLQEVKKVIPSTYDVVSLSDIGIHEDIPETGDTLEKNAALKAQYVFDKKGIDVFAEDSGLEVMALDMAPGVLTARYAGPQKSATDNMNKLLHDLEGSEDRSAQFRAVICYIKDGKEHLVEGVVKGTIAKEIKGEGGFGYDPIFIPEGYDRTWAELPSEVKYGMSHRSRAIEALLELF